MSRTADIKARFCGHIGTFALDVDFACPAHGVTAIYGPSGSGKSTLLRCIAGLTHLPKGFLQVGGEVWQSERVFRAPHQRDIGFVFQEASLFAHLNVRHNLTFARVPSHAGSWDLDDVVAMLGLQDLLTRMPHNLSGGERQRVAIGRALLSNPRLLVMDEPLSAMDPDSRQAILRFLEDLKTSTDLPVLFVTHDMDEVERMADHLVLMRHGRVLRADNLTAVQQDTRLRLAHRRATSVVVNVTLAAQTPDTPAGHVRVQASGAQFIVPRKTGMADHRRLRILARDVTLLRDVPPASSILNHVPVRIVASIPAEPEGQDDWLLTLALGEDGTGAHILARVSAWAWQSLALETALANQETLIAQIHALDVFSTPVGPVGKISNL